MDGTRTFELKVGIFILIGIAILFVIVFSIGEVNLVKYGYRIRVIFNFASGIGGSAPVRLAGVGVGQVESIKIVYDERGKQTKAELVAWIKEGTKIEEDAVITINTLGLLGEKYLEIFPGTPGKPILKNNDMIVGHDPVPVERLTESLANIADSATAVIDRLKKGEGTVGKLLVENDIYENLKATAANFKAFSEDIRAHPWKLLAKPRDE